MKARAVKLLLLNYPELMYISGMLINFKIFYFSLSSINFGAAVLQNVTAILLGLGVRLDVLQHRQSCKLSNRVCQIELFKSLELQKAVC